MQRGFYLREEGLWGKAVRLGGGEKVSGCSHVWRLPTALETTARQEAEKQRRPLDVWLRAAGGRGVSVQSSAVKRGGRQGWGPSP